MTIDPLEDHVDEGVDPSSSGLHGRRPLGDDVFPNPTAGMVLHRVLAMSARTFLLNDLGDELDDQRTGAGTVDALHLSMGTRPLWAQSAIGSLKGTQRRDDETERIHQIRVSMRRIRSNLRSFRLLLDPGWNTALRAELAWYGNELGKSRDLDLLGNVIVEQGPEVLGATDVARITGVIDWRREQVTDELAADRSGSRRFHLTEQMTVLWEGPEFKANASKPASEVLPAMLHRSWHDLRGAARRARKDPSDAHLHLLRIRLKDLRYGAETLAFVEGGPARKTAKAAERLQSKLGDLHDVTFSIAWLESLAAEQPDLADAAERLVAVQRSLAEETRKGWKRDLKEVGRRWRRWQG
jgi:CHAD domain-containing protein